MLNARGSHLLSHNLWCCNVGLVCIWWVRLLTSQALIISLFWNFFFVVCTQIFFYIFFMVHTQFSIEVQAQSFLNLFMPLLYLFDVSFFCGQSYKNWHWLCQFCTGIFLFFSPLCWFDLDFGTLYQQWQNMLQSNTRKKFCTHQKGVICCVSHLIFFARCNFSANQK